MQDSYYQCLSTLSISTSASSSRHSFACIMNTPPYPAPAPAWFSLKCSRSPPQTLSTHPNRHINYWPRHVTLLPCRSTAESWSLEGLAPPPSSRDVSPSNHMDISLSWLSCMWTKKLINHSRLTLKSPYTICDLRLLNLYYGTAFSASWAKWRVERLPHFDGNFIFCY